MTKPVLEEDEEEGTMKHFVVTQLNKFFIGHLPIDSFKELPPTYMYYFGTVAYIATIVLFIYFTYTSYESAITQPYISISTSGASCSSVSISITDDYMADNKGNWIGTPNFVYSSAEFLLTFNNFQVDSKFQYEDMLQSYQSGLIQIGEVTATQNLAQNLVYWMCYIRYYDIQNPSLTNFSSIGHGSLQYLQLTGDPVAVFDLSYVQGHIISKSGYCTESAFAYYDQANGVYVTNQNYSDFISKPECLEAINPLSFGYYPSIDENIFQLGIDVYAFATAVAVNSGVLAIENLGVASSEFYEFKYDNVTYRTGQYFDIRYPMMNTIICIQNVTIIPPGSTGVSNLCMYQVAQTLAIPIFNHFGTSYEFPTYCDCETNGKSEACQTFNLLAALLFYPSEPDEPGASEKTILSNSGIFDLLVLVTRNGGYANLNRNAYNASFAGAAPAYGQMSPELETTSWLRKSFSFCTLTTQSCTLLVFNAFDALSKKVSPFKYQLNNGSCHNSISIATEYWDKLVYNTPTALTQDYYDCYQSPESALFSALGIASGNTSLAVPIIVMALLPLLYLLLVAIRQVPPKEEYSDPEKNQAIEILSILLLRLRDGKTRGVKKDGVLMKLTKELIAAAKEEGGYPDSDDEDEDEPAPLGSPKKARRKSSKRINSNDGGSGVKKSYSQSLEDKIDSDDEEERPSATAAAATANGRKKSDDDRPSQQFRRSSGKGAASARRPLADKRERGKLSVFTRQLEEPKPTVFKRKSAVDDGRGRSSSVGYLSNMFGRGGNANSNNQTRDVELATYADDATNPLSLAHYANAGSGSLPRDLQVMNSEALGVSPVNKFSKSLTGDDIDLLVDDLIKLFGEALKEGNRSPNAQQTGESFQQAKQLSNKLSKVVLSELLERDDKTIFFKLSNALCMHASIDLKLEMRVVGSKYSDRVAYNIGGKILTISNLDRIM